MTHSLDPIPGGQVTALSAIDLYLYVGTTRGCVLVTEAVSLVPLCLFQGHSNRDFFIKTIFPILPPTHGNDSTSLNRSGEDEDDDLDASISKCPAIVTIGRGYHNAMKVINLKTNLRFNQAKRIPCQRSYGINCCDTVILLSTMALLQRTVGLR